MGIVQHEELGGTGLGVDVHVFVLVVVIVERVLPLVHAIAPVLVKGAELFGPVEIHELHTAEHGVAHQYGEPAPILDHLVAGAGGCEGCRGLRRLIRGAGVLPFVHQAGVDGAYEHAQPGDDVLQPFVALFDRYGACQRPVGVGQVAQQRAFGARDVVPGDVTGEIRRRLDHVAHHGFGAQPVVVRPWHIVAVLGEGRVQQILQRLRVGDLGEPVHTFVVVQTVGLHVGHGLVFRRAFLSTQHLARILKRGLDHGDHIERVGLRFGVEQFERSQ